MIFKKEHFQKYDSYIYFVLILGIFISAFYIFSGIFVINNAKPKTIVLENNLFENDFPNNHEMELQVESIYQFSISYPAWNFNIVDNNSLVFTTIQQRGKEDAVSGIYLLSTSNNKIVEIDRKDAYVHNLAVSLDGQKLLYSLSNKENTGEETYVYDLQEKEIQKTFDGTVNQILPNASGYIGTLDEYLFIQDLNTNERKNIISLREFEEKIGSPDFIKKDSLSPLLKGFRFWNFKISTDGNSIYFMGPYEDRSATYRIDLKDENSLKILTEGKIIDFTVLNNRNLMIQGSIQEEEGIFLYNIEDKNIKTIIKGNIDHFDITSDGRLAYILQNNKGIKELHVAYYDGDEIRFDEIIYIDSKYANFLKWSRSGNHLFYVNDNLGGSEILRFTLNIGQET